MDKPKVVTLCGSTKHHMAFFEAMSKLTLEGYIVIPPGLFGHADFPPGAREATNDGDESTAVKQMLDDLHFRKIDISDEIFVVDVDGYVGASTRREIMYARRQGKKVKFLEPVADPLLR